MSFTEKNVFELLPAIYRIKDKEQGDLLKEQSGPLKELIDIIAVQAKLAEKDITQLYNNWFIETCEEWVVPYIGDLLGVRNLHPITGPSVISQRAYVANTLSYRRRKGIAPVLEQLAQDIAGWRAHVTEFFELLSATQYMNHTRLHRTVAPDLRRMGQLDLLNTAFDTIAHSVDVRHISSRRGKYNIPNIGLFVWRLQSYPVSLSDARIFDCPLSSSSTTTQFFTFDPLGNNTQLFNRPETETSITHISEEINVPGLLRRRALFDELEARRQAIVDEVTPAYIYFDDRLEIEGEPTTKKHPVFEIFPGSTANAIPPEEILICSLEQCCTVPAGKVYKKRMADGSYTDVTMHITAAVDPVLGKFILADPAIKNAKVSYAYGFSGDVGAGTFNRQDAVVDFLQENNISWQMGVSKDLSPLANTLVNNINDAVSAWNQQPAGTTGIIAIMDDHSYFENLSVDIKENSRLLLIAADWPERKDEDGNVIPRIKGDLAAMDLRPHLSGNINVTGTLTDPAAKTGGGLLLNGLLIEGKLSVAEGNLGLLTLSACTLVPGKGGLEAKTAGAATLSNQWMKVILQKSICGSVNLYDTNAVLLSAEDCILDYAAGYAVKAINTPSEFTRTTMLGQVHVKTISAENCLFNDTVKAERRQEGCIRFCFVPGVNPETPRRFRCQPELELNIRIAEAEKTGPLSTTKKNKISDDIRGWLVPGFSSVNYGHHAYAQLSHHCPVQVTTGADNASEMGVFNFLQQPQRQANLGIALEEYLPLGLEAGIIYVT